MVEEELAAMEVDHVHDNQGAPVFTGETAEDRIEASKERL